MKHSICVASIRLCLMLLCEGRSGDTRVLRCADTRRATRDLRHHAQYHSPPPAILNPAEAGYAQWARSWSRALVSWRRDGVSGAECAPIAKGIDVAFSPVNACALFAGASSRAVIEDAVQRMRDARPPLRGPTLEAVLDALRGATKGNEAAWAFAVQAGAYEQLTRCMDAYLGDAELQAMCCSTLTALGHANVDGVQGFWAGHAEAAVRAGAVRAVVCALHAHGARCLELVASANALASTTMSGGPALEIARDGRTAEALARGLPLALRAVASSGDTFVVETVVSALNFLVSQDGVCAQQVAHRGTLGALAEALRTHGAGSFELALAACSSLEVIIKIATVDQCAAAADGCMTALRAALVMHDGNMMLQALAWGALCVLLSRDVRLIELACATDVAADAVRSLRGLARMRAAVGDARVRLGGRHRACVRSFVRADSEKRAQPPCGACQRRRACSLVDTARAWRCARGNCGAGVLGLGQCA